MPNTIRREKTFTVAADRLLFDGHNAGVDGDIHIDMGNNDTGVAIFGCDMTVMNTRKILNRNIYDSAGNEVFGLANNKVTVNYTNGIDFNNKALTNANIDSGTVDGISSLSFQNGASVSFAGATSSIDFGNNTITNFNLPPSSLEPNSIGSNNGFTTLEDELDQNRTETLTALARTQAPYLSANKIVISNGSGTLQSGSINPNDIVKTSDVLSESQIPNLPASRINEGAFHEDRIPPIPASRLTSGTLDVARIPSLPTSKITSGTFDDARIPSLNASKTNAGTFDDARIPSLNASKTNAGTFDVARIPDIPATKITSGTLSSSRIPDLDGTKITTGTISDARLNSNILRSDFNNQTLTANGFTIDGGNSGDAVLTLKADGDNNNESDNAFIDFIQDGGTLGTQTGTRGRIGLDGLNNMFCGISTDSFFFGGLELRTHGSGTGSNYKPVAFKPHNTHTVNIDHLGLNILSGYNLRFNGSNIAFSNIGGTATESQIPSLNASKINAGTFDDARIGTNIARNDDHINIPTGKVYKINNQQIGFDNLRSGSVATDSQIPSFNASKVNAGVFDDARLPTNLARNDDNINIPSGKVYKVDNQQIGFEDLRSDSVASDSQIPSLNASKINAGTIGDARIGTNIVRNDDHINIPSGKVYKINNQQIGFDNLRSGSVATDSQLPTNLARNDDDINIPSNKVYKINNQQIGFDNLRSGSVAVDSQLPTNLARNDDHINIPTGKEYRINSQALGFNHLRSGSVATASQLPTNLVKNDQSNTFTTNGTTSILLTTNSDTANVTPFLQFIKNQANGTNIVKTSFIQYNTHFQFHPINHTKFHFGSIEFNDNDIQIPSNKKYKVGSNDLNFSHLAGSVTDSQLPTTVLHSDEHVNIATGKEFQINSQALGFNHLRSGSVATDSQLPTNLARNDDHINIPTGKEFRINSQALGFNHLRSGSVATDSQLPTNLARNDDHINIPTGKEFRINSQALGFNHLRSGSVATDSQLPTNRIKTNVADQTISQGVSTGSHLRIRHASNLSLGGGADNPNIHVERSDAVGNVSHRGTFALDHAHDDIVISNSDSDGGVAFYNNNSTFLGRLDNNGMNIKSGLTYKIDGTEVGFLTTGAQGIQGVKTFADKPIFTNGIKSDTDTTLGDTTGNPLTTINGSVTLNANLTQSAGKTTDLQETNINGDLFVNEDLIQASGKSISTDTVTAKTVTVSRINFDDDDHSDTTTFPRIEDFQDSLMYNVETGERHEFQVNAQRYARIMNDGLHVMNGSVDRIHLKHTGEIICHKADGGATLQLENGQLSNPTGTESQIAFSYNGNSTFRHFIRSRHASGNAGNSLDFLINQQNANADLNDAGTEEVFRIRQDSIDCLKPILNNAGAGQYGRFLASMNLGESFLDSTKVLKMSVAMYRLNSFPTVPERFIRLDQGGGHTDTLTGLGKSIGEAYTSNPSTIIVNHTSTDMNNSSHTNSAVHVVRYGSSGNDPFGSVNDGQNSVVTGRGYLYKNASGTNPFETAVKNAERTLWQVRTKTDDDFKLTINGESIQVYEYGNNDNITSNASFYKNSIFEMVGDYAFIEYKNMNGSGGAYVNLVFQCLGTI